MPTFNVRHISDEIASRIKRRAQTNKRSTEAEIRSILRIAAYEADAREVPAGEVVAALDEVAQTLQGMRSRLIRQ